MEKSLILALVLFFTGCQEWEFEFKASGGPLRKQRQQQVQGLVQKLKAKRSQRAPRQKRQRPERKSLEKPLPGTVGF